MSKELTLAKAELKVGEVQVVKSSTGKETKVITCEVDKDLYKQTVEEAGLSMKDVHTLVKVNNEYKAKVMMESAIAGSKILKDNKDADAVEFVAPYMSDSSKGRGHITATTYREKEIIIPGKGVEKRPTMSIDVIESTKIKGSSAMVKSAKDKLIELMA